MLVFVEGQTNRRTWRKPFDLSHGRHSITFALSHPFPLIWNSYIAYMYVHRGYYTAARRYKFYLEWQKHYFTNERSEWVKYFFYHEKVKFISSSHRVIFFLLYGQEYLCTNNSVRAGNDIIDILTSEDMENMPLESWM